MPSSPDGPPDKMPDWWRKPRSVCVVVDRGSWIEPHALRLVTQAGRRGDRVRLIREQKALPPCDVAFHLGAVRLTPPEVMTRARISLVVHESDLPRGRGFAPVAWQILEGAREIPVRLFRMVDEADAGPVVGRTSFSLRGDELLDEWRELQGHATVELCLWYLAQPAPPPEEPQAGDPTWYPRRRRADDALDPDRSLADQFDRLRVADNLRYPAYVDLRGHRYLLRIEKAPPEPPAVPATVVSPSPKGSDPTMTTTISIADRPVGPAAPVYVIAEIGMNHGGDMGLAEEMIAAAASAGADAVKFQSFRTDRLVVRSAPHYALVADSEIAEADHERLIAAAERHGVHFLSTAFDVDGVAMLAGMGVPALKLASMSLNDLPLLRAAAATGLPLLLSTGMGTAGEIATALDTVRAADGGPVVLLHCVSQYPTPPEHANLRTISLLQQRFGPLAGYSDHVVGPDACVAAVALGAVVVEKHFISSYDVPGIDREISADTAQMAAMIRSMRTVQTALGTAALAEDRPDRANAALFRTSWHTAVAIPRGTVVSAAMLKCVRPGGGLPPDAADRIIGRRAAADLAPETLIAPEHLEP